jgi:hypothetical protein
MHSIGQSDKQIANALDIGLRTVELERNRVAKGLGLPTSRLLIWAVENRAALNESLRSSSGDVCQTAPVKEIRKYPVRTSHEKAPPLLTGSG